MVERKLCPGELRGTILIDNRKLNRCRCWNEPGGGRLYKQALPQKNDKQEAGSQAQCRKKAEADPLRQPLPDPILSFSLSGGSENLPADRSLSSAALLPLLNEFPHFSPVAIS